MKRISDSKDKKSLLSTVSSMRTVDAAVAAPATGGSEKNSPPKAAKSDKKATDREAKASSTDKDSRTVDSRSLDKAQMIIDRVKAMNRSQSDAEIGQLFAKEKASATAPVSTPSPTTKKSTWTGLIKMESFKFVATLSHIGGPVNNFEIDLPDTVDICGKIQPAGVSDYLRRLKHANKDIVAVKVEAEPTLAANAVELEEICRRLKERGRLGVVQELKQTRVKDFYLAPLNANERPPEWFPHRDDICNSAACCLVGIVICHKSHVQRRETRSSVASVQYHPTPVSKTNPRGDIKSTIAEAEKALAQKMSHMSNDVPALSGGSAVPIVPTVAAHKAKKDEHDEKQKEMENDDDDDDDDEAYDPEREWGS